jgi:hypothetical protein
MGPRALSLAEYASQRMRTINKHSTASSNGRNYRVARQRWFSTPAWCFGRKLHRDVRRVADDPRTAIGVSFISIGGTPKRLQQQKELLGEHGVTPLAITSQMGLSSGLLNSIT